MQNNSPNLSANEQYALIGKVAMLLSHSSMHRHFDMLDLRNIILPAVHLNQFRIYENDQQEAVAFVAWAFFSPEVERKYLAGRSVLTLAEWNSGDKVYVTDLITRGNNIAKQVVADLKQHVFADSVVHALRFDSPGSHRPQVSRYFGVNIKKGSTKESKPLLVDELVG